LPGRTAGHRLGAARRSATDSGVPPSFLAYFALCRRPAFATHRNTTAKSAQHWAVKVPAAVSQNSSWMLAGRVSALALLAALASLSGCDTGRPTAESDGSLKIVTGQEADTWSQTPLPQSVLLELVGTMRTPLATVPAPATAVSLGVGTPPESPASFEVTAFDADNNALIHGVSVPFTIDTFAAAAPTVFVGRTGSFSRAPGGLVFEYRHPLLEIVGHAYVIIAGGDVPNATQSSIDVYDLANWVVALKQIWLPRVPKSWAVAGTNLLVIDETGAIWVDITKNTANSSVVTGPTGLNYADIVGGKTLVGANDTRYIVGATRAAGDPTDRVLRVASDGTLRALTLSAPRLGAAAAVVAGQLVVTGGSDSGAGAEVLNADETAFVALAYPPDATQGAALAELTSTTAVVVGGVDPTTNTQGGLRTIDLTCTDSCSATPLANADFSYSQAQAFHFADGKVLVTGESPDGETHAFTLGKTVGYELTEQPLRTPRIGATGLLMPNGQVGLVGGDAVADGSPASSVELFFPVP
jgi:hypothetical protein